ncbi:MAG: phosphoribosyltransferase [Candidatus Rokubacteria bacterium]|nr:phosphoribosyltransferase [Candidatus Rokubacteria bacterium]
MFANREAAGRALAERLAPLVGPCVVAGIPRGGVAVALLVAERLGAPLTAVFAHKLAAPFAPELAFGAIDEDGDAILDAATVAVLGLTPGDVETAKAAERQAIERRIARYGAPALAPLLPGRAAVLVDDGLATGLTMRAALAYARRHGAREVTVATPVASGEAAARFAREADRFVSLVVDDAFQAVGEYYADFAPVPDEAVVAMLASAREAVQ